MVKHAERIKKTMAKIDFQEIVAQVLNGDTNAYDQLIEALTYKMLRYAESITHDQSKAEEAVQEAFIDCYLHLPSLRDPNAFEGFLASDGFPTSTMRTFSNTPIICPPKKNCRKIISSVQRNKASCAQRSRNCRRHRKR